MDSPCTICKLQIDASLLNTCVACKLAYYTACIPPTAIYTADELLVCCTNAPTTTRKKNSKAGTSLSVPRVTRSASQSSVESVNLDHPVPNSLREYLKSLNDKMDRVLNLAERVDRIEQNVAHNTQAINSTQHDFNMYKAQTDHALLRSELVISGLPESPSEDLVGILLTISKELKVVMEPKDVLYISRSSPSQPSTSDSSDKPRTIVANLSSPKLRTDFIQGMRLKKALYVNSDDPAMPRIRIYINEQLPPSTRWLLGRAKAMVKGDPHKYCYIYRGAVYYRPSNGAPSIAILEEKDLGKINI